MANLDDARRVTAIVSDAGGQIVGRTRLQKIAFFLEQAGFGAGFQFRYKHYGPYSEQLAQATQLASIMRFITEKEGSATWGGSYSIFSTSTPPDGSPMSTRRRSFLDEMVKADAVELELAATAAFLAIEGIPDPWGETARRKPEKAEGGRLLKAKQLYSRLRQISTLKDLPNI
ncbi:hypothetical protein [Zavarzinia sp.]|uniref:hypothetical protein n=1 Tax=Zavarzinia sp. TaxID=2027920 RepID=UPI0035664CAB